MTRKVTFCGISAILSCIYPLWADKQKCFLMSFSLSAVSAQHPAWQQEKSTSQARVGPQHGKEIKDSGH